MRVDALDSIIAVCHESWLPSKRMEATSSFQASWACWASCMNCNRNTFSIVSSEFPASLTLPHVLMNSDIYDGYASQPRLKVSSGFS